MASPAQPNRACGRASAPRWSSTYSAKPPTGPASRDSTRNRCRDDPAGATADRAVASALEPVACTDRHRYPICLPVNAIVYSDDVEIGDAIERVQIRGVE